jgi:hypothetical protein
LFYGKRSQPAMTVFAVLKFDFLLSLVWSKDVAVGCVEFIIQLSITHLHIWYLHLAEDLGAVYHSLYNINIFWVMVKVVSSAEATLSYLLLTHAEKLTVKFPCNSKKTNLCCRTEN